MSKTLDDLRERLFDTIDGVKTGKVTVERARTISDLCQVVINSAKVEVDYRRVANDKNSRFLGGPTPALPAPPAAPAAPAEPPLPPGIVGVRRHVCRDD